MKNLNVFGIVIALLFFLSLVGTTSAMTFDNRVKEVTDKIVIIDDNLGLGGDLVKVELVDNTNICGYDCYAVWNVEIYHDDDDFISMMNFEQIDGSEKEIQHNFKLLNGYNTIKVPIYEEHCTGSGNSTTCLDEVIGYENKKEPIWEDFNPKAKLAPGNYTIKLNGRKELTESIDWKPTFYGKKINEWAWWAGAEPDGYYKFENNLDDSSSNQNDLFAGAGNSFDSGNYKLGSYSRAYGGTNADYVTNSSFQIGTSNFTFALWLNASAISTNEAIVSSKTNAAGTDQSFTLRESGGNLLLRNDAGGSSDICNFGAVAAYTNGNWQRIVVVREGVGATDLKCYVNNTLIDSGQYNENNQDNQIFLGNGTYDGFTGNIDEFSFFNGLAWSSADVTTDWNNGDGNELETSAPSLELSVYLQNPPTASSHSINSMVFNSTHIATNGNLTNTTFYLWYDNGTLFDTNFSLISGTQNQSNISVSSITINDYVWNQYTCSSNITTTLCLMNDTNFTVSFGTAETWVYFQNSSYETDTQQLQLNLTVLAGEAISYANLTYHNNTIYQSTVSNSSPTAYTLTNNITNSQIGANTTISFNWTVDFVSGSEDSSNNYQQELAIINLSYCGTYQNTSFVNFTFKDESNGNNISAAIDSSTWFYWLGDGTYNKSLSYSNTDAKPSYSFCFDPSYETIETHLSLKYSNSTCPQRTFSLSGEYLSNNTLNQTLYLLSSSDGIYTSINTVDSVGGVLSGVRVLAERTISGSTVTIGDSLTDSSGLVTFWVNPNYPHTITATKTGYSTATVTITPTQSLYTLTMSTSSGNASYTSELPGVKWVTYPSSGTVQIGATNFNITVTSSTSNLENCKFNIVNSTNISQILDTDTSITNTTYCYLENIYTVVKDSNLFGQLYIDTTESDGFVLVNADWKWIAVDIDAKAWRTLTNFFSDLTSLQEFGEGNEGEFSRLMFFFIIVTILMSVLVYFSGVEIQNPGIAIVVIWLLCGLASAGGLLTFHSGSDNISPLIEQWGFFFMLNIIVIGYFLNNIRRFSE